MPIKSPSGSSSRRATRSRLSRSGPPYASTAAAAALLLVGAGGGVAYAMPYGVVSLDAKDRRAVYEEVVADVQKAFPDYELQVAMDTDFAEE